MELDNFVQPTHSVDFASHISIVEFSPFEWSQNLICVAMAKTISIGIVKFQEENIDQEEELEFHLIREFQNKHRVCAVTWSPETSLSVLPKVVKFAVASSDFNIRIITSDLVKSDTTLVLSGHESYICSLAYDPNSRLLASGSDDQTVKLWEDSTCVATLCVTSPVVSVCWHRHEPNKLLVAEQNGVVRLFNARTQRALLSLAIDAFPLSQVHWSLSNSKVLAAVAGKNLVMWDLTQPSNNDNMSLLYTEGAVCVAISPSNHHIVATIGEPKHELKVTHTPSRMSVLTTPCKIYGGMTWHYKHPYICVSVDRKLCLWKVGTM